MELSPSLSKGKTVSIFDEVAEGTGIFELVALDGLPTKSISNSNNPPNCFRLQDSFIKNPKNSRCLEIRRPN